MLKDIEILKELAGVEERLGRFREKEGNLPRRLEDVRRKKDAEEARYNAAFGAVKAKRKEYDALELDFRSREDEIKKNKVQLNSLKTNIEYNLKKRHIADLLEKNSAIEDRMLVILDEMSDAEGVAEEIEKDFDVAARIYEAEERDVNEILTEVVEKRSALEETRRELSSRLSLETQKTYEKISAKASHHPVCAVEDGICQGCFMSVTKQTQAELIAGDSVLTCQYCGRIMYIA